MIDAPRLEMLDTFLATEGGPTNPDYLITNSVRALEAAAANGLCVSFPAHNELQIDLDTPEDNERFARSWEIAAREFGLKPEHRTITPSKSGEGAHVRVRMPFTLTPWQRIALQAAMGSDPVRELLSAVRLHAGDPSPTLLFETPEVARSLTQ